MKRICCLVTVAIVSFCLCTTVLYAQEPQYPFFKQVVIWGETAFAVTEDHVLYYWGADPRTENSTRTREPVKYMENVSAILDHQIIKNDGNTVSFDGTNTGNMIYAWGNSDNGLILNKSRLLRVKGIESSLFTENVVEVSNGNVSIAILKSDGSLWNYELYGEEKATLISDNVQSFDASFMNRFTSITTYYVIKKDGTLWELNLETNHNTLYSPNKLLDDIIQVVCYEGQFLALKTNGTLLNGRPEQTENEKQYRYNIEEVLNQVSTACISEDRYLAIKTDGTIWYWGEVIGGLRPSPQSRSVLYEVQPTPIQLSFDPKVNWSYVHPRMEALLTKEDRLLALGQFYDYYAEYMPEYFTTEELENFKQFSVKAAEEAQQSSQPEPTVVQPANIEVAGESSAQQSSSGRAPEIPQNGDKAYVWGLAGIVVLCIVAGFVVVFRKRLRKK